MLVFKLLKILHLTRLVRFLIILTNFVHFDKIIFALKNRTNLSKQDFFNNKNKENIKILY